jgi:hypothetical protein
MLISKSSYEEANIKLEYEVIQLLEESYYLGTMIEHAIKTREYIKQRTMRRFQKDQIEDNIQTLQLLNTRKKIV